MFEKKYTMDDASWYEYLAKEKAYLDQNSRENWAKREKEEALQKGLQQGRIEGTRKTLLENIKGLLKIGIDEQTIKKGLNCTDEQIQEAKSIS